MHRECENTLLCACLNIFFWSGEKQNNFLIFNCNCWSLCSWCSFITFLCIPPWFQLHIIKVVKNLINPDVSFIWNCVLQRRNDFIDIVSVHVKQILKSFSDRQWKNKQIYLKAYKYTALKKYDWFIQKISYANPLKFILLQLK